jgi:uncharacterized repeat protein (TIGR01451 family)
VADPDIGDGFYTVFAPAGNPLVTATPGTLPAGYTGDSANVAVTIGQTTGQDFEFEAGQLAFTPPGGPSATIPFGTTTLQQFGVQNQGAVPASYTLLAATQSHDFENGVPPAGWTSQSAADECPWSTNAAYALANFAGGQGFSATVSSDFCGLEAEDADVDTRLVSPTIDLSAADVARLDFVLAYRHLGTSRFDVDVSTNGGGSWTNVYTRNVTTSQTGPGTPVSIDLTPYAGLVSVQLRLRYVSAWDWWVQVDQLRLLVDNSTIPWLGFADIEGLLAPSASAQHPVQFRADRVPQPGLYTAALTVTENTPYPAPSLLASLTATTPASFGTISGTVTSQGYCDANPAPLEGATVSLQGSAGVFQTTTDEDGNYTWLIDSAQGPFHVAVSAAGHIPTSASGIALSPGGNADVDLDPRAALPCFDVVENSLSATLEQGDTAQRVLNLANSGAGAVDPWQVSVGGSSSVPIDFTLTQSLSSVIVDDNAIACGSSGITANNSFMRVYQPSSDGFVGNVTIESIRFGVEAANATVGSSQAVEVAVYALDGPIESGDVTLLGAQAFNVPDGTLATHTVTLATPITVAATQRLVIELFSADGDNTFFPGTNAAGETAPSYIMSADCAISAPISYEDLGFPGVHLILDVGVNGPKVCGAGISPVDWLSIPDGDGTLAPDASEPVDVAFSAVGKPVGNYGAAVCVTAADPQNGALTIPASMNVVQDVADIDLSVSVTDSADPAVAGAPLAYAVSVANAGPTAATGVTVSIALDPGVAYDGFSGSGWACSEAANVVGCSLTGTIAAAGNAPALTIDVTPITVGERSSSFVVASTENDVAPANNTDVEATQVTAAPSVDVTLNASVDPSTVTDGSNVRLRIIAANVGSDDATGVEVAVALPADVEYASATGTGWSCVAGANDVVCTLAGTLDQGFAPTLDITLTTEAPVGNVEIDVTVSADGVDSNAANNSSTVQLTVNPASDRIFGGPGSGGGGFED